MIKETTRDIDNRIEILYQTYNISFTNTVSSSYNPEAEYEYAIENDNFDTNNKFQLEVMDLKKKWKKVEYEYYFSTKKGVSFDIEKKFREL